jgi:LacI family transcriptional regulator
VCARIPTVAIGHDLDCFCVAADDRHGGELAAEHLLNLGRKRVAVLQGEPEGGKRVMRVDAFLARLSSTGVSAQTIQAHASATPSLQGYRALAPLLGSGAPFDGLFCETDELALGAHDHAAGRFVALMHQALSHQLGLSGWSVELITSDRFNDSLDIGGLILVGIAPNDPRPTSDVARRIPTVAIGHDLDCFCVAADDNHGGELAAKHLLSLGRKSLAVLQGTPEGGKRVLRVDAFVATARAAGAEPTIIEADANATPSLQGYRALAPLLRNGAPFDGLFCETDELALGALAALEDAKVAVPRDVAVVGFDDLPDLASRLTTIRQDFPKLAEAAIKLLAEARRGVPPRNILMPTELVRRQTT